MATPKLRPFVAPTHLRQLIARVFPSGQILDVTPLGPDLDETQATHKATGYGRPLKITVLADERRHVVVLHHATANEYGHERRADRARDLLLGYDTFHTLPRHVLALDVGAVGGDGGYVSLRDAGEFYLLTTYAQGEVYADQLRRVALEGARPADRERAAALARWLVEVHALAGQTPSLYRRAVRQLVGDGEGIFGIIDGYPADVPAAPPARLQRLEQLALAWRWRLRDRTHRLRRIHGDFHPFNVVWGPSSSLHLLDASRGSEGDPADDVTCMAINFPFFALGLPGAWVRGLRDLWQTFWDTYLGERPDDELLEVAAPYWAWRTLVLASPRWYPALAPADRDRLLTLAERYLEAPRLELARVEDLFAS